LSYSHRTSAIITTALPRCQRSVGGGGSLH